MLSMLSTYVYDCCETSSLDLYTCPSPCSSSSASSSCKMDCNKSQIVCWTCIACLEQCNRQGAPAVGCTGGRIYRSCARSELRRGQVGSAVEAGMIEHNVARMHKSNTTLNIALSCCATQVTRLRHVVAVVKLFNTGNKGCVMWHFVGNAAILYEGADAETLATTMILLMQPVETLLAVMRQVRDKHVLTSGCAGIMSTDISTYQQRTSLCPEHHSSLSDMSSSSSSGIGVGRN